MKNTFPMFFLILLIPIAFATACKKTPPTAAPVPAAARAEDNRAVPPPWIEKRYSSDPKKLELARQLYAEADVEDKQAVIDQKTMVAPAPAGFHPEPVARKIRLTLVLEKSMIRRGERPRFRLEMTNVGREAVRYSDLHESFFKSGYLDSTDKIRFQLTGPLGRKTRLSSPLALGSFRPEEIKFPPGMTDADKAKWAEKINNQSGGSSHLNITLAPGETLRSYGDGYSPRVPFLTLTSAFKFDTPGTYKLQVEFDDRPAPLTEEDIQRHLRYGGMSAEALRKENAEMRREALGPAVSNSASFEVVP